MRAKSKDNTRSARQKSIGMRRWVLLLLFSLLFVFYICFYHYSILLPLSARFGLFGQKIELPEGKFVHGIDISRYQQSIDWKKLSKAKLGNKPISFVFIKATEGKSILDENFNDNFYQAKKHGLLRGVYHYYTPSVSGKEQARYFLKQAHLEEGDLPPVLDIEVRGEQPLETFRGELLSWLQIVEQQYGKRPILYSSYKFKKDYLNTPDFESYPFWIAHYYVRELEYEGDWTFWQHTDKGSLPGIPCEVDLNIFNGTISELKQMTIPEQENSSFK